MLEITRKIPPYIIHFFRGLIDVFLFVLFIALGFYEIAVDTQVVIFVRILLAHGIRIYPHFSRRKRRIFLVFIYGAMTKAFIDLWLLLTFVSKKVNDITEFLGVIIILFIFFRNLGESWSMFTEVADND